MLGWSIKKTRRIRNLAGIKAKRHKKHVRRQKKPEIEAPDNLLREYYKLLDESHPEKGYTFEELTKPELGIWVQDFTYIWWHGRFYFLAGIEELSTRRIVGWCFSLHHDADMVCAALDDAMQKYPPPTILHDDRGSEYLSIKHAKLCSKHHIKMSASAAGKPTENGFMESFFSSFKTEMLSIIEACASEQELHECIAAWIYYYNHIRIHTSIRMTPESYANTLRATKKSRQ